MGKREKSLKRKNRETEVALHKSIGDKDGLDVVDDLSEPTMGDKLASLNLEGNDKALNHENADISLPAKPPSADSVNILVKQALRADDRTLLIDCLYRQDEKVIANSLALLNPSDVLKFLKSLVPIILLRGAVLACSLPWVRSLLLQHASSIMSQESSLAALNSLFQTVVLGL
ncbi:WD repeat protein [Perilla frutescens var. hirtella]|nr:WD repeat protein [Perilla frutescens var. hirtella]